MTTDPRTATERQAEQMRRMAGLLDDDEQQTPEKPKKKATTATARQAEQILGWSDES